MTARPAAAATSLEPTARASAAPVNGVAVAEVEVVKLVEDGIADPVATGVVSLPTG